VTEVLRHLQTEDRDAVPVLSENGHYLIGWATAPSVLRAIGRRLGGRPPERAERVARRVVPAKADVSLAAVRGPRSP
jgi:hypothetical protein